VNAALLRWVAALEQHSPAQRLECPDIEVVFVTARLEPESTEPLLPPLVEPATLIELEPGEDLNAVAIELGITLAELYTRMDAGAVRINYPPASPPPLSYYIDW